VIKTEEVFSDKRKREKTDSATYFFKEISSLKPEFFFFLLTGEKINAGIGGKKETIILSFLLHKYALYHENKRGLSFDLLHWVNFH